MSITLPELENPFGDDPNDMPIREMQLLFNRRVRTLMHPKAGTCPSFNYCPKEHRHLRDSASVRRCSAMVEPSTRSNRSQMSYTGSVVIPYEDFSKESSLESESSKESALATNKCCDEEVGYDSENYDSENRPASKELSPILGTSSSSSAPLNVDGSGSGSLQVEQQRSQSKLNQTDVVSTDDDPGQSRNTSAADYYICYRDAPCIDGNVELTIASHEDAQPLKAHLHGNLLSTASSSNAATVALPPTRKRCDPAVTT